MQGEEWDKSKNGKLLLHTKKKQALRSKKLNPPKYELSLEA